MAWEPETLVGQPKRERDPETGTLRETAETYGPADTVRCECGRRVQAQMMVPVAGLPAGLARRPDTTHVCDACREAWVRLRKITRYDLAAGLGAPPASLQRILAGGREWR